MKRNSRASLLGLACCSAFWIGCSSRPSAPDASPAKTAPTVAQAVSLTRTISIAARMVADPSTAPAESAILTLSEGGEDEEAEGPSSFDVLPDGGFVITDPLRKRIVFYDAGGRHRFELQIFVSAERLRVLPNNALSVVRHQSGLRYIFESDGAGQYKAPRLAAASDPDPDAMDAGTAKLLDTQNAAVSAVARPGSEVAPIAIRFEAPGESMVSIQRLGSDSRNRTYVAIESASSGDRVDVRRTIRKYSAQGQSLVQISDIPLDSGVYPADEFRVREGVVYQMVVKPTEVRLNVWDTNATP